MKALLSALLICAILAWSPFASADLPVDDQSLQAFGRSMKCDGLVVTHYTTMKLPNGTFQVFEDGTPFISLYLPYKDMPERFKGSIFYHELGHCMQYEQGSDLMGKYRELNADWWSAELMCQRGLNGIKEEHDLLTWFHDNFGYEGDIGHGTLQERLDAVKDAPSCIVKHFA